ncbi:hypothetical protein Tco_0881125 [Tanacetum coccineum]
MHCVERRVNTKTSKSNVHDLSVKCKDKIIGYSKWTSKVEIPPAECCVTGLTNGKEGRNDGSVPLWIKLLLSSKEWNSGDDQLRLRWMIYLVVLADAAESIRDTIGFESPILWAEIGESSLTGPELVLDSTDKVVLIKEKLKAERDRQKSYADKRRKPLEFEVGDRVLLKVYPWKGVVHFGRKKCLADANLHVLLNEIKIEKTLRFVEELVEIMDHEIRNLKHSKIPLVKVHWNSKHGPEFTWEREDHMMSKYPHVSFKTFRKCFFEYLLYELPEDFVSIIFEIILELQPFELITT